MNKEIFELYTDFLISSFRLTTAVSLSEITEGKVSHDKISRLLREEEFSSKDLWKYSKNFVREIEDVSGVIVFDDSIVEKPYTDENEIIAYHFDHAKNRNVKGINFITALYYSKDFSIPIAYELVKKELMIVDEKTGNTKRKSSVTKNELMQKMLTVIIKQDLKFSHILFDSWYGSADNFIYIHTKLKKKFISCLKSNRLVALSMKDKLKGKWSSIDSIDLENNVVREVYIQGIEFPFYVCKQVFKNEDESTGEIFLCSNDSKLNFNDMTTIYHKRWKVEEFHKSLKQNASLGKSPTKTVRTQSNHFFASLCAFIKLEVLKAKLKIGHFKIKAKIYSLALANSYQGFYQIRNARA
ncbi:MAG: transposase [Leptospiraceae bacterium]|nr:transposase [Saprospirales bacterium]MBK9501206.1 transposase [Leptospiraceae bacterium]